MTSKRLPALPSLALLLAAAPPLAAQAAAPRAGWQEVMRDDAGTTVSVDLGKISRTRDSTFLLRTEIRFPEPVELPGGKRADHEIDLEELDCGAGQSRGLASGLYLDTAVVAAVALPKEWAPVDENRRAVFDARCGWLLTSFASELPTGYELSELDEQPELTNARAVAAALSRVYPPGLREKGDTGRVVVRFRVTAEGMVDPPTAGVVESTSEGFSRAALEVVRTMRFRPAKVQHRPVAVWVTIPVSFQLQGSVFRVPLPFPLPGAGPQPSSPLPRQPQPEIPPSMRPEMGPE
jgi:TonB family protein